MIQTPIIKQCPLELTGGKILFVSSDGKFYNKKGREIKPDLFRRITPACHGSYYPMMRYYNAVPCHILVCTTFHGSRPEGYECDHINGNIYDWRAKNLQWVKPAENKRRARYLRILRAEFTTVQHWQTFLPEDYLRFFDMPFDEFKDLWTNYPKMEGTPEEIADYWDWRGRIESRA